jgi:hypothetical protein
MQCDIGVRHLVTVRDLQIALKSHTQDWSAQEINIIIYSIILHVFLTRVIDIGHSTTSVR